MWRVPFPSSGCRSTLVIAPSAPSGARQSWLALIEKGKWLRECIIQYDTIIRGGWTTVLFFTKAPYLAAAYHPLSHSPDRAIESAPNRELRDAACKNPTAGKGYMYDPVQAQLSGGKRIGSVTPHRHSRSHSTSTAMLHDIVPALLNSCP